MKYRNLVLRTFISGVIFSFFLAVSHAEVTLDGTLGPSGLISGPDYMISDDLGQLKGGNLFHSFGIFNAITGESATFTGPNSVENILGRVTGGSASIIDGCLSSQIPGANLFLMNPSGLMFGPNAFGGPSGNIQIVADNYLATPDSVVTASSALGIDGEVVINAPATDVISGVEAVPAAFLDIASLLSSRCAARTEAAVGSFVKLGRGGVPPPPDGLRPSYYLDVIANAQDSEFKDFSGRRPSGFKQVDNPN